MSCVASCRSPNRSPETWRCLVNSVACPGRSRRSCRSGCSSGCCRSCCLQGRGRSCTEHPRNLLAGTAQSCSLLRCRRSLARTCSRRRRTPGSVRRACRPAAPSCRRCPGLFRRSERQGVGCVACSPCTRRARSAGGLGYCSFSIVSRVRSSACSHSQRVCGCALHARAYTPIEAIVRLSFNRSRVKLLYVDNGPSRVR